MSHILHVTQVGHKCHKPAMICSPARYIKAGEILQFGGFELWYNNGAYLVGRNISGIYEFSNFNCASAKLVELGSK